jgi:hypothetical protein
MGYTRAQATYIDAGRRYREVQCVERQVPVPLRNIHILPGPLELVLGCGVRGDHSREHTPQALAPSPLSLATCRRANQCTASSGYPNNVATRRGAGGSGAQSPQAALTTRGKCWTPVWAGIRPFPGNWPNSGATPQGAQWPANRRRRTRLIRGDSTELSNVSRFSRKPSRILCNLHVRESLLRRFSAPLLGCSRGRDGDMDDTVDHH